MYFNPATNQINYYQPPPRITFTINLPAAATINIGKNFSGVTWGDGSTTVAQTHAYASAGSYTITIFNIGNQFPSHPSFTPYITNVASIDGITIMYNMFLNNAIFNQDISGWDVSNVTHMNSMFQNASAFNRNISTWNVSNVMNMDSMFQNASAFNQNISSWNVSNVTNLSFMLLNCPIRATPSYYTSIQARANAVGQSLA
jgi:surface protein